MASVKSHSQPCFPFAARVTWAALLATAPCSALVASADDGQVVSLLQVSSSRKAGLRDELPADASTDSELPGLQEFLEQWRINEKNAQFPNVGDWMDSEGSIEARLNNVIAGGHQDPCAAKMQVHWPDQSQVGFGGMASYYYNEIFAGVYTNLPMAFRTGPGGFQSKMWSKTFSNTAGLAICHQTTQLTPMSAPISYDFGRELRLDLHQDRANRERMHRVLYVVSKKMLDLQADVKTDIDSRLSALGIGGGSKYIGVHIRRGDKVTEDGTVVPSQNFSDEIKDHDESMSLSSAIAQLVRDAADRAGCKTVFLASDDSNAVSELSGLLGSAYQIIHQAQSSDEEYQDRSYAEKETRLMVLTDVEALARSTIFIGTGTSAMGRLAYVLREPSAESVSLGTSNTFLFPY